MRLNVLIAAFVSGCFVLIGLSAPAAAFGWDKRSHCHHHHVDGQAAYHCHGPDPYAYRYETRGYYPYYKSQYWRPAHKIRRRRRGFAGPRYYPAWGYYKRRYHHKRWHSRNHGGHRFYYW